MSRIRSSDTTPELLVRRMVHRLGYRYRLHAVDLPGKPDLVFRRRRKAVFVHGCFWHQHADCPAGRVPQSNIAYWSVKLQRNIVRDKRSVTALLALGWQVLVVWQCEIADAAALEGRLQAFLDPGS